MTSFYVFIILLLSVFCQLISTESVLNDTATTSEGSETDETPESTIVSANTTIKSSETTPTTILESTVSVNTTSINQSTTSTIDSNQPSQSSSKKYLWLLIALVIIIAVLVIGIIHYYRQQSPYRRCTQCWRQCKFRFLQHWRSRDEDADNIILQLEPPEVITGQWPPRISFA